MQSGIYVTEAHRLPLYVAKHTSPPKNISNRHKFVDIKSIYILLFNKFSR